jgi:hypothetical protein
MAITGTASLAMAATFCDRVQATLGKDHPWTGEVMKIRDQGANAADTIDGNR